jgi:hypothetical protein
VPAVVFQVYSQAFQVVATKIGESSNLVLLIDGTSDIRGRNPIAIGMTGFHKSTKTMWYHPIRFCEPEDHKALTQLREIETAFKEISEMGGTLVTILDLEGIVFDSTGSNTGLDKGLAGELLQARSKLWKEMNKEGEVPVLIIHKCEDHILNLMSQDLEKKLIEISPKMKIFSKHRATDVVQLLISLVCCLNW